MGYERTLRNRSKRWSEGVAGGEAPEWKLEGFRSILAQAICFLPPLFTLGTPILWALINIDQIGKGLNFELFLLSARSIALGIAAAFLAIASALVLTIAKRWTPSKFI